MRQCRPGSRPPDPLPTWAMKSRSDRGRLDRAFLPLGYPQPKHQTASAIRTVNRDMSYDPSHRMPPRQERWPQATPAKGWPSYRDGEGEPAGRHSARAQQPVGSHRRQADPRSAVATAAFPVAGDAYGTVGARDMGTYDTGAYDTGGYRLGDYTTGTRGQEGYGYTGTGDGYADATDGFDGAADSLGRTSDGFNGAADSFGRTSDGFHGAADSFGVTSDSRTRADLGR